MSARGRTRLAESHERDAALGAPVAPTRFDAGGIASAAATAILLGAPTALAFFSGGYFDVPRLWAALVAWALLAAVLVAAPRPLPAARAGRAALAGLGLLVGLAFASAWWAPLRGPAFDDSGRDLLYLAALACATAVLGGKAARAVEPALVAGATVVIAYGLSERLLPGLVDLAESRSALGRLEQPLTYWNATGALAAIGLVLALRIAGDPARRLVLRCGAGAATAPLGAGLALTYSRGAILAALAGVLLLVVLRPAQGARRAIGVGVGVALLAGVAASLPAGVRTLGGSLGRREVEGALTLGALLALTAAAALAVRALARGDAPEAARRSDELARSDAPGALARGDEPGALARGDEPGGAPVRVALAVAAIAVLVGLMLLGAALDRAPRAGTPAAGATARRLASTESNRYAYWRVALRGFAEHPLRGLGGGGFGDLWLHERTVRDPARDAHSLYLETAAEYGLAGLAALGLVIGGVTVGAARAWRRDPALAAGPLAGLAVWAVHAGIDWDWEMPALTLVAVLLAGLLLAAGEQPRAGPPIALRAGLAATAVAVAVVVAVGLRAATLAEEGRGLLPSGPQRISAARFARAESALRRAGRLTPDPEPDELRAILVVNHGRLGESIRLLDGVVRAEPRNGGAWALLAGALQRAGSPRAPAARARARALAPRPVPPPGSVR